MVLLRFTHLCHNHVGVKNKTRQQCIGNRAQHKVYSFYSVLQGAPKRTDGNKCSQAEPGAGKEAHSDGKLSTRCRVSAGESSPPPTLCRYRREFSQRWMHLQQLDVLRGRFLLSWLQTRDQIRSVPHHRVTAVFSSPYKLDILFKIREHAMLLVFVGV